MRLIFLGLSLFIVSNTYAAMDTNDYIYSYDSNEMITAKKKLYNSENKYGETVLETLRINKNMLNKYDKSEEAVYKVNDISKKDVSVKIGMSKEQVLSETYWGKPDRTYKNINKYDRLELWTYDVFGSSLSSRRMPMLVFRNNILAYIIP